MTLRGIDVSNWQGRIDYQQVAAAGFAFGVCKASEGTAFVDGYLESNLVGMKAVGMERGCYHYCKPDTNSPEAEAAHFLTTLAAVGGLEPGVLVALDLEEGSGDLSAWVRQWHQIVRAALACSPLIYTSSGFMQAHGLAGIGGALNAGLWLAAWGGVQPTPADARDTLVCWQYASNATVPGVIGPCDVDLFLGSREQWRAYGVSQSQPQRQPTNDERIYLIKFITAEPPDLAGLAAALEPFR